ncbi:endonuclease/exonuclease/phosphatase family protein [Mariniphaga sp.]|uniref:endonuclease/exonuclease/phosphatase family protein n=1 Tax=Mariniphaga sp. TaxID=1954475 RepID=UPI003567DD43
MKQFTFTIIFLAFLLSGCRTEQKSTTVRFATFNVAFYRDEGGRLQKDLEKGDDEQVKIIAEIIQRVRPDVLALQEFDFNEAGKNLELFQENYLSKSFNGSGPIHYPYVLAFRSNTGVPSGLDLNNDGETNTPEDAFGYGVYPGQYAFAILSKYPLVTDSLVTFREFLWKDMPGAHLPVDEDSTSWYSQEVLEIFRLSSKNHVDIPVTIHGKTIHVLMAHPTPPGFDGDEDRNGKRNHDEIRLFADYISPEEGDYLYDDNGNPASLNQYSSFVILGDMNADPFGGNSFRDAINLLLEHPRVHPEPATGKLVPSSEGSKTWHEENPNDSHPEHKTAVFNRRVDYVLPSADLQPLESGVFWFAPSDSLSYLTTGREGSDHRLVWVDVSW